MHYIFALRGCQISGEIFTCGYLCAKNHCHNDCLSLAQLGTVLHVMQMKLLPEKP